MGGCGDDDGTPSDGGTFDGALDGGAPDDAGSDAGRDAGYVFDASFSRPDVDVTHPMDETLRLNHLQCEGTHNSYHRAPPGEFPDWQYDHAPLDVQLESQGVRQFELDVWWNNRERLWHVYHVERIDDGTTCERLLECLATIRTWSDAHPGHHPIFVQNGRPIMQGIIGIKNGSQQLAGQLSINRYACFHHLVKRCLPF